MDRRRFLLGTTLGTTSLVAGGAAAMEPLARRGAPRINLSCCAYSLRQYLSGKDRSMSLHDFVGQCAEWGIDGVELTSYYFDAQTPEYCHQLRRACFLAGIDVSGTAVGNKFALAPGDERDKQLETVSRWVDLAVEMGAPCMRVFGGPVPKETPPEQASDWAIEALDQAAAHAAERGVFLALENHGGVTATADGVVRILEGVESDWIGANLDTGNFQGPDPYEQIARVAPYAVNVHLKAEVRGQPADFPRIAQILRDASYSGYASLEYESSEDPMAAIPRLVGAMRGAFG